MNFYYYS